MALSKVTGSFVLANSVDLFPTHIFLRVFIAFSLISETYPLPPQNMFLFFPEPLSSAGLCLSVDKCLEPDHIHKAGVLRGLPHFLHSCTRIPGRKLGVISESSQSSPPWPVAMELSITVVLSSLPHWSLCRPAQLSQLHTLNRPLAHRLLRGVLGDS